MNSRGIPAKPAALGFVAAIIGLWQILAEARLISPVLPVTDAHRRRAPGDGGTRRSLGGDGRHLPADG